ncbi:oligosaccharide flippase family protein [Limnohabitans sp. DM1]|uniref:oligosaccharide flippase family protein n=1 Tax=Limnohabitans sp. DM1 TaxID=1597955 RepID=UPI000ABB2D0C|nr:oligosaccharide flippase family protein [Limnohabitans sp. DM1]
MARADVINWMSLLTIQAANAVTPLVIFPFALFTLGPNKYAALVTTEAIAIFVIAVTLYSFEIDGPSRIIKLDLRRDKAAIEAVYSEVFYARLVLFTLSATSAVFFTWLISDSTTTVLLAAWMLLPLSYAVQPNWLFQAIEKNFALAAIVLSSRLTAVGVIIIFVTSSNDVILIPLTIGVCYVAAAILTLIYVRKNLQMQLQSPFKMKIGSILLQGKDIFIGNLAVTLYRDANTLLLSIIGAGTGVISIYSIAEKLTKAIQTAMRPLTQLFFPKILRSLALHPAADIKALRLLFPLLLPQLLFLCASVVTFLACWIYIIPATLKSERWPLHESIFSLIVLMIPAAFFGIVNFVLGSAGLNFLGHQRYLRNSIVITGVMNIFICLILSKNAGATGAAISFTFAEGVLLLLIFRRYVNIYNE